MEQTTCNTNCCHPICDMEIKLEFPEPDYSRIRFLPATANVPVRGNPNPIGPGHYLAVLGADVPYSFTIGAVTFAGVLYIRGDHAQDTYTDGVCGGAVNGTFHIDRSHGHVRLDGVGVRAHVLIDFEMKHAVGWIETLGFECCGYRNWGKCDTWNSSDQVILASW